MMMKNKKGQGLSISTIIIAILALLVLVILALVFSGSMGSWSTQILKVFSGKNCGEIEVDGAAGLKVSLDTGCGPNRVQYTGIVKDLDEREICCVKKKS